MTAALRDIGTIFYREWLRYRRDRAYWAGQVIFPFVVIAFIGFGLDEVVTLPSGASYVGHVASGVLALVVASGAVGAGFSLIQDREGGFLRVLMVAPIAWGSVVLGKVAARLAVSAVLVSLLALLFAGFTPIGFRNGAAIVLGVTGLTVFFVALGIALASRLHSLESFRLLSALATVPLYMLSGMFYPLSTLPTPTRWLAACNPFSYGVDLLRYGFLGIAEVPVIWSSVLLVCLSLAASVAAMWFFHQREGT